MITGWVVGLDLSKVNSQFKDVPQNEVNLSISSSQYLETRAAAIHT